MKNARPDIICLNCGYFGSKALVRNLLQDCQPDKPAARYKRILSDLEGGLKPFTKEPVAAWSAPSESMVKDLLQVSPRLDPAPDQGQAEAAAGGGAPSVAMQVAAFEHAAAFREADLKLPGVAAAKPRAADPIFDDAGHRILPPLVVLPPARSMRRSRFRF